MGVSPDLFRARCFSFANEVESTAPGTSPG
jgi:hypothetical protein